MDDTTRPKGETDKINTDIPQETNYKSAGQDFEEESINLADYLRVISKNGKMIFRVCGFVVIVTAIVSIFLPKSFSATTSVVPPMDVMQRESLMAGSLSAAKNPMLRQVMDVTSISDMYVGILRSRSVEDALIERFDLGKVYKVQNGISRVRRILRDRTSIKVGDEGIVTITVEDRDPCWAANLANAYVEELDRQNKRLFVGQAMNKKIFLENRLKEMEKDLSQIDNLLSRDAKNKEMLFDLLTREYEIAKIEEAKSMPTIQVLDKAVVPEEKCKPRRGQMIVLAGMISLLAAIATVFMREYLA
jgi:tyrosine-protein kinase Etk/Wzc